MIKILIVDDRETVREILKSYLEEESGLTIVGHAENGQEAIDLTKLYQPDIILMDIEMPIMDGLTATRIISEKFVNTKVLIMSIHNEDNYLSAALQVGAKGYLKKSTPAKELINAIYSAYKDYFQLGPGLLEQYLHKIVELRANDREIDRLKSVVVQQKQLLNSLNKNRKNSWKADDSSGSREQENANLSTLNARISTLEMQLRRLSSRFEQSDKKHRLTQQLVVAIVVCNVFLFILFLLLGF